MFVKTIHQDYWIGVNDKGLEITASWDAILKAIDELDGDTRTMVFICALGEEPTAILLT